MHCLDMNDVSTVLQATNSAESQSMLLYERGSLGVVNEIIHQSQSFYSAMHAVIFYLEMYLHTFQPFANDI